MDSLGAPWGLLLNVVRDELVWIDCEMTGLDLKSDLLAVRAPVLILSDEGDSLHENDGRARALRPWFGYHLFSNGRSHGLMIDPARWSGMAAAFVREVREGKAPVPGK